MSLQLISSFRCRASRVFFFTHSLQRTVQVFIHIFISLEVRSVLAFRLGERLTQNSSMFVMGVMSEL